MIKWLARRKAAQPVQENETVYCVALRASDGGGLTLLTADAEEVFVDFSAAARAYRMTHSGSGRCVADRDVTQKRFDFAGASRVVLTLQNLAAFNEVRSAVQQAGFTTFDLT